MTPHSPSRRGTAAACAPFVISALAALHGAAFASSHREAPAITNTPKVDSTDFYMFRSYEAGRDGYVTLIANYQPLQDAYGGPNYFKMDPNALYEIHIDNNGDAREDITFQFKFRNTLANNGLGIQVPALGANVSIPLTQGGTITEVNSPNSNVREQFSVDIVRGDRRTGTKAAIVNATGGAALFDKPVDNIGTKTFPSGYAAYAAQHIYTATIPGCAQPAKVFAGQRKEGFAVNLGTIFDLVNAPLAVITDPTLIGATPNTIGNKNVTSLAVEVHRDCLTTAAAATGPAAVIGGWQTASLRQGQLLSGSPRAGYDTRALNVGPWTQVSRLGMPLVNEVVIGLKDKDRFNSSKPSGDGQFLQYVTNPTLPVLIGIVQGLGPTAAPTNAGRNDLVTVFLTGIQGVNQQATVTPSEMMRLNTAIPPVAFAAQNRLGIVGNILAAGTDNAGYPNGRRPKDDVVDISLVAVMGGLCVANGTTDALKFGAACVPTAVAAPLRAVGTNGIPTVFNLNDTVDQATAETFLPGFPYLNTPLPGSPPAP